MIKALLIFLLTLYLAGVLLANISNKRAKAKGMEGISPIDTLNPIKWFSVMYGLILSIVLPYHVFVQIAERVFEPNCQNCVSRGVCEGGLNKLPGELGCGCATYAKMLSPFEEDYSENWSKVIFSKKKLFEKRKDYPAKIKAEITWNFLNKKM